MLDKNIIFPNISLLSISTHDRDQFPVSFNVGYNELLFSVREYSIITGTSGITSRFTIPCCSKSFRLSDKTFPLIPIENWRVQNRCVPDNN